MNKKIGIISGVLSTSQALKKQLLEYTNLLDSIELYGIEDLFPNIIECDLMIYSSDIVYEEVKTYPNTIKARDEIVALRTVNFETIDALFRIPKNEKVYIVNDAKETTYQFIRHLRNIGLEDIEMVPYFPGTKVDPEVKYGISPGLLDHMPDSVDHLINIGPRLFDLETIHQILVKLDLLQEIGGSYSERYLTKIVNITKRSGRFASEVSALNERLKLIMASIDEGVMVIDKKNTINIINQQMLEFFNAPYRDFINKSIDQLILNQDMVNFCIGLRQAEEAIFTLDHVNLVFTRQKLSSGFIIIFVKNIDERILETNRLNQELIKKGHVAKYDFNHIIGGSTSIKEAKYIAHKLARSELTILIEGESGTGKELFASAIHNASNRSKKAYLAINFSAFTDDLIESELFGYDDGAFTGAKKGGKVGLFELANGGTILLDEIGDISPKMQTKLLRVLQEREIIRIGGTIIHSVDVRIIAATNKNLRKMVDEGAFREDLYYRLKMGTLKLPPLRHRKEDIPLLISKFIGGDYQMSQEAESILTQNPWKGNIRELKASLEYMKAISESSLLTVAELPQEMVDVTHKLDHSNNLTEEERLILQVIHGCNLQGISCGRQNIYQRTFQALGLSENQIRSRLNKLSQKGYIQRKKGRAGSFLTEMGIQRIKTTY